MANTSTTSRRVRVRVLLIEFTVEPEPPPSSRRPIAPVIALPERHLAVELHSEPPRAA